MTILSPILAQQTVIMKIISLNLHGFTPFIYIQLRGKKEKKKVDT